MEFIEMLFFLLLVTLYPVGFLLTAILYIENDIVANPLSIICWPIGLIQFIRLKIKNHQAEAVNYKSFETFEQRELVKTVLKEISNEH